MAVNVEGMDELYKKLNQIAKSLAPEKIEPILLKGAHELQAAVREKAPQGPTGNLKKGVRVFQLPKRGDNPRSAEVQSSAKHSYMIEHGTSQRYQKTTGRYTGVGPAKPFFRPAIDANKERVYNEIVNDLRQSVESVVK